MPYDSFTGLCSFNEQDCIVDSFTGLHPSKVLLSKTAVRDCCCSKVFGNGDNRWRIVHQEVGNNKHLLFQQYDGTGWITKFTMTGAQLESCSHLLPCVTDTYDVGNSAKKWKDACFSGSVQAQNFRAMSDRKLKRDVHPIQDPLDICRQLNGYTFRWKDTGKLDCGLIAQEVQKILPQLVTNNHGTRSVNYLGIIAVLLEAVKTLNEQVRTIGNNIRHPKLQTMVRKNVRTLRKKNERHVPRRAKAHPRDVSVPRGGRGLLDRFSTEKIKRARLCSARRRGMASPKRPTMG